MTKAIKPLLAAICLAFLPTGAAIAQEEPKTINICDRTSEVRDSILEILELEADDCAAVPADRMADIDRLDVFGSATLQAGDFDDLDRLETLYLHNTQLATLPAGIFNGLAALQALGLFGSNQQATLPAGVFNGLAKLEELDLNRIQLTTLPPSIFDGLAALQVLNLGSNQLATLPAGVFDGLAKLERLYLNHNQLATLPPSIFDGLAALQVLSFWSNQLATLPPGIFDDLMVLEELYLNHNQLTSLPPGIFDDLAALQVLSLEFNQLRTLPVGIFDDLTMLKELDLNRIQLRSLPVGVFDSLTALEKLYLNLNHLRTLPPGVFDGLVALEELDLEFNQLRTLPAGVFDDLAALKALSLLGNELTSLLPGVFDELAALEYLILNQNQLDGLTREHPLFANLPNGVDLNLANLTPPNPEPPCQPEGGFPSEADGGCRSASNSETVNICDRTAQVRDEISAVLSMAAADCAAVPSDWMAGIEVLRTGFVGIAALRAGDFGNLDGLEELHLSFNQLTTLPDGIFAGLSSLKELHLRGNRLAALPEGVFAGLSSLEVLYLDGNRLATLPEGVFAGLSSLEVLYLSSNRLATLPEGAFTGLSSLKELHLSSNRLATLPEGVFAGLSSLEVLSLGGNRLATLPEGVFAGLSSLEVLYLNRNHLLELERDDPLFAGLPGGLNVDLSLQSYPPYFGATVPLLISSSDPERQGFVRIINEFNESGMVRILAFDDAGTAADPVEIPLGANQAIHFNSGDLENGNPNKGIEMGIGSPAQGNWRLDLKSALDVRVLAYVRTNDGFLTAMHDLLSRDAQGRLAAWIFNPASNVDRVSKLRLVNRGEDTASVTIGAMDDNGAPPASSTEFAPFLELPAGASRTLSALELEQGAEGLSAGMLGDGVGKWQLSIMEVVRDPDSLKLQPSHLQSVIGMSLLDSVSGHLSNLSTGGDWGGWTDLDAVLHPPAVPFLASASDSVRRGFVRIINESNESGMVRILSFDDAGTAADPVEIPFEAKQTIHFNSRDLENGNPNKGIETGIGSPAQGDWRLDIESGELNVRALAYVRTHDGFLTAMHDRLQRDSQGRLAAWTFNPASNVDRVSKLRLVNIGANDESLSIEGIDDQGNSAGPVTLTLAAGESRTLSALDLEEGAQGLTGTLGDGAGKWRLFVTAGDSVMGMSLLQSASGHLSNLSTMGVVIRGQ